MEQPRKAKLCEAELEQLIIFKKLKALLFCDYSDSIAGHPETVAEMVDTSMCVIPANLIEAYRTTIDLFTDIAPAVTGDRYLVWLTASISLVHFVTSGSRHKQSVLTFIVLTNDLPSVIESVPTGILLKELYFDRSGYTESDRTRIIYSFNCYNILGIMQMFITIREIYSPQVITILKPFLCGCSNTSIEDIWILDVILQIGIGVLVCLKF